MSSPRAVNRYLDLDWDAEAFYLEAVNVCLESAFKPMKPRSTKKAAAGAPASDQT